MERLDNKRLSHLKGLAQKLDPVLKLGKQGLTANFLKSMDAALEHHELIKIKFDEHKEERKELSQRIATETGSHLVTIVGHVAVFYREHSDPAKRKVQQV